MECKPEALKHKPSSSVIICTVSVVTKVILILLHNIVIIFTVLRHIYLEDGCSEYPRRVVIPFGEFQFSIIV